MNTSRTSTKNNDKQGSGDRIVNKLKFECDGNIVIMLKLGGMGNCFFIIFFY